MESDGKRLVRDLPFWYAITRGVVHSDECTLQIMLSMAIVMNVWRDLRMRQTCHRGTGWLMRIRVYSMESDGKRLVGDLPFWYAITRGGVAY
jgi:hypothetical protein